jgi:hypothetical protein
MNTIQGLIDHLNTIEDKSQPVIYQYYLAEHFEVKRDKFAKLSAELDGILPAYADNYELIDEALEGIK